MIAGDVMGGDTQQFKFGLWRRKCIKRVCVVGFGDSSHSFIMKKYLPVTLNLYLKSRPRLFHRADVYLPSTAVPFNIPPAI